MKVLFIIKRAGIGGVQTFTKTLIDFLKSNQIESDVFLNIPDFFADEKAFDGYNTYTLTSNKFFLSSINKFDSLLKIVGIQVSLKTQLNKWYFRRLLRKNKYDLIHLNTDTADTLLNIINNANIPLVLTLHGIYKSIFLGNANYQYEVKRIKKITPKINVITYLTNENLVDFKESLGTDYIDKSGKFINLFNPYLSNNTETRISDDIVKFGLFGRGFESKGWREAFIAFKQVYQQHKNIELHFFGKGEFLEAFVSENQHTNFFFHGQTFNSIHDMKNIDIGLVPSYHEEMPYVIIEYLSLGIPVIGSDVGAIRTMLEDDSKTLAGQIINLENSKPDTTEIVSAMTKYLTDQRLYKFHSEVALKAFKKFDIHILGEKYLALYKKVVDEN